eukprot:COSAG05_NODE_19949_length_285_cov_0.822581_1_plen_59_part_10
MAVLCFLLGYWDTGILGFLMGLHASLTSEVKPPTWVEGHAVCLRSAQLFLGLHASLVRC